MAFWKSFFKKGINGLTHSEKEERLAELMNSPWADQPLSTSVEQQLVRFCLQKAILPASEQNPHYNIFKANGFHLLRDHFYIPVPNEQEVSHGHWEHVAEPIGIDIKSEEIFAFVEMELLKFFEEFRTLFPLRKDETDRLPIINGSYMAVDAHMYYALLRYLKPKKCIEIGAGNSTTVALAALEKNKVEGSETEYVVVEPYPTASVKNDLKGKGQLITETLQKVPLDTFMDLENGDILFIDSSHVLRAGNDVWYEYLEIIPRLKKGVYVHIHDISFPENYPHVYYDNQLFWNEQYLLQTFLMFNNKFAVVWPGNFLRVHYFEKMKELFPEMLEMTKEYPLSTPTAFWIKS